MSNENDVADPFSPGSVAAEPTMARLREGLAAMRAYRGPGPGKVSFIDAGRTPRWPTSEEAVLPLGLRCVAEAERDHRIADNRERLKDRLRDLAATIRPRADYSGSRCTCSLSGCSSSPGRCGSSMATSRTGRSCMTSLSTT